MIDRLYPDDVTAPRPPLQTAIRQNSARSAMAESVRKAASRARVRLPADFAVKSRRVSAASIFFLLKK
ncbi:unnamed protein product, partial [Iphiclides podalirius]